MLWVLALFGLVWVFSGCVTAKGIGQTTEMTDDEYSAWVEDSTTEVSLYVQAALEEGDLAPEDVQAFVEDLDRGIWGSLGGKGYWGLAVSQALIAARDTLKDKGIDPVHGITRFSQYQKALSKHLKAVLQ